MRAKNLLILYINIILFLQVFSREKVPQRPRILISTDISGTDPDDNQSMIHYLMYSDLFEIEGLVSSPSFGEGSKEELIRMIDLYEQDYPKLKNCYPNLMSPKDQKTIAKQGHNDYNHIKDIQNQLKDQNW